MSLKIFSGKLDVSGASLAYRIWKTSESNPLILLIPGCTPVSTFSTLAETLSSYFTVVGYERRGYGQSVQESPPSCDQVLRVGGDDAAALIKHFSPSKPVVIFGTSGGAMVSFELLRYHGDLVKFMVLHEPPVMTCIADGELPAWKTAIDQVISAYNSKGIEAAADSFGKSFANEEDAQTMTGAMTSPQTIDDAHYFFKHEIGGVPSYQLDMQNLLSNRSKLVFVGGALSKDQLPHKPMETIAQKIKVPIKEVAGGHVAYAHPRDAQKFSNQILELVQNPMRR